MKVFSLFALITLLPGLSSCSQGEDMAHEDIRKAIVLEVLMERFGQEIEGGRTLVLSSEFSAEGLMFGKTQERFLEDLESEAEEFGASFVEAARDLFVSNFEIRSQKEFPSLPFSHVLHSEEEWKIKNQKTVAGKSVPIWERGWTSLLEEYSDSPGFISLSRPGLSEDGTVAFIYLETLKLKGQGCSGGNLYVFILVDGEWVLSKDTLEIGWIA